MFKLISATNFGGHVLFDPLALSGEPADVLSGTFTQRALRGELVYIDNHCDEINTLWIFVEEEPAPDVLAETLSIKRHGLLRVPSGTLLAAAEDSIENMNDARSAKHSMKRNQPESCAELPPGDYWVDAFLRKYEDRDAALKARLKSTLTPEQQRECEDWTEFSKDIYLSSIALGFATLALAWFEKWMWAGLALATIAALWWFIHAKNQKSELAALIGKVTAEFAASRFDVLLVLKKAGAPASESEGIVLDMSVLYTDTANTRAS